ncbi:MAG: hypothetical protein LWW85_10125 [Marinilabiliales bacterium]|nr:hypothetical protein [Marinilabiliales bacterium]
METKQHKKEAKKITRGEAIKKAGKIAGITAASMFLILNSKKAAAQSAPDGPGMGGGW